MAEFISAHQGIRYKVPESDKAPKFERGRLATSDEEVISYLREHPDYGTTLTETDAGRSSMVVGIHFCPQCDKVFKSKQALAVHMRTHGAGDGEAAHDADA